MACTVTNIVASSSSELFSDCTGIERDWIPFLKEWIRQKMNIDNVGVDILADRIAEVWCVPETYSLIIPQPFDEYYSVDIRGFPYIVRCYEDFVFPRFTGIGFCTFDESQ